jgi:DUF4097 and DUF4098 domain-containing protein YvlB
LVMRKAIAMRWALAMACTATFAGVASTAGAQSFDSPQRVDTTVSLERGGTVSVSVWSGHVNVTGNSGSSVRIRGTVERDAMEVRARSSNVTISMESEYRHGGRAELDITVPEGTSVVIEGYSASYVIQAVKAAVKAETLSGSIRVTDARGKVNVSAVSGNVDVTDIDGDVRAESVSGTITMSGIEGDIEGESVSGEVSISRAKSRSVRAETVSAAIAYRGTFDPSGTYTFKSHSGQLLLGMPADAGASVTMQTFSGNVDSDFPVTLESGRQRLGHESRMEFKVGNGRSRVVVETFSGDIKIQRSTTSDNRE